MKILVLSDSHASLRFMRNAIDKLHPNVILHLGDYYDDGQVITKEYPEIPFHQVPGNCDRFRCPPGEPEVIQLKLFGVSVLMTHGHRHGVKTGLGHLLREAYLNNADAVLFGHTHEAYCTQEGSLWILNPGSCGHSGGSVGLLEVKNDKIVCCSIIRQENLEV